LPGRFHAFLEPGGTIEFRKPDRTEGLDGLEEKRSSYERGQEIRCRKLIQARLDGFGVVGLLVAPTFTGDGSLPLFKDRSQERRRSHAASRNDARRKEVIDELGIVRQQC